MVNSTQNSLNSRVTLDYKISSSHSINLKLMLLNRGKTSAGITDSQTEMINSIQYKYRFQYQPFKKEEAPPTE